MKNEFEKKGTGKEIQASQITSNYAEEQLVQTKKFLDHQLEIFKSKLKKETQNHALEQFHKLRESLENVEQKAFVDYEENMKTIEAEEKKLLAKDIFEKRTIELRKKRLQNSLNRILDFNKKTLAKFVEEFL